MNLLIFCPRNLVDDLPYDQFDCVYVLDDGTSPLDCQSMAETASLIVVTTDAGALPEDLLTSVTDVIEVDSDPTSYLASRGVPGDVAVIAWDSSDAHYEVLESLCRSGVTVLDAADEMVQISLDLEMTVEDLIATITRRVTADVLRQLRAELGQDTPRRSRFRSSSQRGVT